MYQRLAGQNGHFIWDDLGGLSTMLAASLRNRARGCKWCPCGCLVVFPYSQKSGESLRSYCWLHDTEQSLVRGTPSEAYNWSVLVIAATGRNSWNSKSATIASTADHTMQHYASLFKQVNRRLHTQTASVPPCCTQYLSCVRALIAELGHDNRP